MSEHDANARYVREAIVEPDAIARARAQATELGAAPISAAVGAQCAVLAAAARAQSIVEIGTGAGVSGLWLLRGAPDAVLTTIDNEPEHLAAARRAFLDARVPGARARVKNGPAPPVKPPENQAAEDNGRVVAGAAEVLDDVAHGLRLVRPGGLVLVPRVLAGGRTADPVDRSEVAAAYRSLIQETQQSPAVLAALSQVGEGLLQLISLVPAA